MSKNATNTHKWTGLFTAVNIQVNNDDFIGKKKIPHIIAFCECHKSAFPKRIDRERIV